jgi:hypothetical protein
MTAALKTVIDTLNSSRSAASGSGCTHAGSKAISLGTLNKANSVGVLFHPEVPFERRHSRTPDFSRTVGLVSVMLLAVFMSRVG